MSGREHVGGTPLTRKAIAFAIKWHSGQMRRESGLPYVGHPIMVYGLVWKYKESANIDVLLAAAVLHDVLEECEVEYDELVREFGEMVAGIVLEVTNDEEEKKRLGKRAYLDKKLLGLSSYALVVKLADMLANMTESPRIEAVERMAHHCRVLLEQREGGLSETHRRIIAEILWNAEEVYGVV